VTYSLWAHFAFGVTMGAALAEVVGWRAATVIGALLGTAAFAVWALREQRGAS